MTSGKQEPYLPPEILELARRFGFSPESLQYLLTSDTSYAGIRMREEYRDLLTRHFSRDALQNTQYAPGPVRPTYQKQSILPPPENVLIQFIGGPKNGEQEYKPWKEWNTRAGQTYTFLINEPVLNIAPSLDFQVSSGYRYKLTFIPMSETPFSDAQIVIGIFQE